MTDKFSRSECILLPIICSDIILIQAVNGHLDVRSSPLATEWRCTNEALTRYIILYIT